ncbi:hypothetical protein QM334_09175 [Burkholderia cenocepacia]|nr:hypothetical protein [Burkholderia cenocepacia]
MQEPQTGEIAEQFAFFRKQRRAAIAEKCSLIAFMAVMRDRRRIPGQPIQFVQCLFHGIRIQVEWSRISQIVSPRATDAGIGASGRALWQVDKRVSGLSPDYLIEIMAMAGLPILCAKELRFSDELPTVRTRVS